MSHPLRIRSIFLDYHSSRELFLLSSSVPVYKLLSKRGSFMRVQNSDDPTAHEICVNSWDAACQEAIKNSADFIAVLHKQHVVFKQTGPNGGVVWMRAVVVPDPTFAKEIDGALYTQFEPRAPDEKPRRSRNGPRRSGAEKRRRKRARLNEAAGVKQP